MTYYFCVLSPGINAHSIRCEDSMISHMYTGEVSMWNELQTRGPVHYAVTYTSLEPTGSLYPHLHLLLFTS